MTSDLPRTGEELLVVMVKEHPGFPQEAVYVLQTVPGKVPRRYRLVHARAREQLQFQVVSPGAVFTEAFIDERTVKDIEYAWRRMTVGARWPRGFEARRTPNWFRRSYYTFEYVGDEYGQGETLSPATGTCSDNLVQIGELLIRLADEPDIQKRRVLRIELQRRGRALSGRLQDPATTRSKSP